LYEFVVKHRSSIPAKAVERVKQTHKNGKKLLCRYFMGQRLVGARLFYDDGVCHLEYGITNRRKHGNHYEWDSDGKFMFHEKYRNGVAHGLARQWSTVNGRLIGSFQMKNGSGIDMWWQEYTRRPHLSEVRYMKDGLLHGVEWWVDSNQKSVWSERHWYNGRWHGIDRQWDHHGKLDTGFPKYYVNNREVTPKAYAKRCETDSTLQRYRVEDDRPQRTFPPEIRRHFRRRK
jgi:antitoxin component YwqK of YwqJK toxin-antitoxin module